MIKKVLLGLALFLLIIAVWQYELVVYGLAQGKGQLEILMNARPVDEILEDPAAPDTLKEKLIFIQEVRQFAVDSFGINDSKNYTTLYDQKGKPSLWVVTAAEPFALTPKEWKFPLLGRFPYMGFFNYDMAIKEQEKLEKENWDTYIGVVGGWSTLGWFKDPILSNMLSRKKGELADLIVHELTHGTLFVKDSVEFNENLATFIGNKGAEIILRSKYGEDSAEYLEYLQRREDNGRFASHILRGCDSLESLYASFGPTMSEDDKLYKKKKLIDKIIAKTDTISFYYPENYKSILNMVTPNNAFFMSYIRYRAKLDHFEEELKNDFGGDLKLYMDHLKETYPSL